MEQRFAVIAEGATPKIHNLPVNQTARLINQIPGRNVDVFETLNDAKEAALALVERAEPIAKPGIVMFSEPDTSQNAELRKALLELTEDRVERYYF